jgi:hypothetical protein
MQSSDDAALPREMTRCDQQRGRPLEEGHIILANESLQLPIQQALINSLPDQWQADEARGKANDPVMLAQFCFNGTDEVIRAIQNQADSQTTAHDCDPCATASYGS